MADFFRGVFVTFVGIAAIMGFVEVWMVFAIGIIKGLCSAFFDPAISSVRPDIVPQERLMNANSVSSLSESGMNMLGSAIGGVMYVAIGAPYMFLFNGISYLFSAFTEVFINVPGHKASNGEITFMDDFKSGLRFMKNFRVLRNVIICSCIVNFFCNAGFILMVPYFKESAFLGAERYGFAMTVMSFGMVAGSLVMSFITLELKKKVKVFMMAALLFGLGVFMVPLIEDYKLLLAAFFITFFMLAVINTISSTMIIQCITEDMRGKVMALLSTLNMGLMPLGTLIGGAAGEVIPIRYALIIFFTGCAAAEIFMMMVKNMKDVMMYDPEKESIESLMKRTN